MLTNIIKKTDGYKPAHWKFLPPGLEQVYAYLESRGTKTRIDRIEWFGLQYILQQHLAGVQVTTEKIASGGHMVGQWFKRGDVYNHEGWHHIFLRHGGRLPLRIRAQLEGTICDFNTPLLTVENTCPECAWLVGYIEPVLEQVWYPTTVGSLSLFVKGVLRYALEKSGSPEQLPWKLHDFGLRGASSMETAALGGAAHLVNFRGSDTGPAIELIEEFYLGNDPADTIPATEHGSIISWGEDHEEDAYRHALDAYPNGVLACVSDSYDLAHAVTDIFGGSLEDKVMERDGVLVVRPDSGDPTTTVMDVLTRLGDVFGYTENEKGYKVLDPHVRVIQGDGMEPESILKLTLHLMGAGWSADNVAYGMGGGLLQKVDRDMLRFAYKPSWVQVDGVGYDVSKHPAGEPFKASKKGRVGEDLPVIFENGTIVRRQTFSDIQARAQAGAW